MPPKQKPPHYRGSYHVQSRRVRQAAYANPDTRCRRCGLTLAERQALYPNKQITWHAGHLLDGVPGSPLVPEHSDCNTSAGARAGNAKRQPTPRRTELTW